MSPRKIVAEFDITGEVLVMWPDGSVTCTTPRKLLQSVKRQDAREVRRGVPVTATEIEWRNVPEGFDPEALKASA